MANPHPAEIIAEAFVEQYYVILRKSPENAHRFYQDTSLVTWHEHDGPVASATTLSGINEKIMSSDFKNGNVETLAVDAQGSIAGGVLVAVSGLWTNSNNNAMRKFGQSFFLAQQEKGYFVLNDILRFSNSSELTIIPAVNDDDKLTEAASSSSVLNAVLSSAASNTEEVVKEQDTEEAEAVKKQEIKKAVNPSIPKDVADVPVAAPLSAPIEKVSPVIKPASGDPKVEAPKITYASVVAKPGPTKVSPPTSPKTSASRVDVAPKAPALGSKASNGVAPKAPARGSKAANGAPNAIQDDKIIYVGGLPYDMTKQGVADVMKQFGPLRRNADGVRLIKHESDGFCCGFVEYESAESARRAVHVHYVLFGAKEAYCTFRRNRDNDGRGRSPPRGGSQNGNSKGRGNGRVSNGRRSQSGSRSSHSNSNGQARGAR